MLQKLNCNCILFLNIIKFINSLMFDLRLKKSDNNNYTLFSNINSGSFSDVKPFW